MRLGRNADRDDGHSNHERWLVSYADFVTLMFAFFVVMFASSNADKDRARRVSQSVERAFHGGALSSTLDAFLHGRKQDGISPDQPANAADLQSPLAELTEVLKEDLASGRVDVRLESRGLVISLRQAGFFPSGDATIAPSGMEAIRRIATALEKIPNPIRLEGHTDSIPIRSERFQSNWRLSMARSMAMLDLLTTKFHVKPERIAVAGYGDSVPVDTNATESGRARNRRVDITVMNQSAFTLEPAPTPDTSHNTGGPP